MSLWLSILLLLAIVKLPLAALMLWLPFRHDEALSVPPPATSSQDDGGSPAPGPDPPDPRPRDRGPCGDPTPDHHVGTKRRTPRRRRGDHAHPSPTSPARVRTPALRRALRTSPS